MDVVELTKELVAVESISGREGKVAKLISDRLEKDGWSVVRQPVPEGDPEMKEPRVNVLATDGAPPRLVLTTHLDTVPPFIPPSEDKDHVFGRGTCDAKGIFAAQWIAAERLRKKGHRGIALLGVVGEETNSIGAKYAKAILPKADFVIDGEPTKLVMTSAAKGILALKVSMKGVAGHSAYPHLGKSAVHGLLRALVRLLDAELPSERELGDTTVNVGTIEGGLAPNVIAPGASSEIVVRVAAPLEMLEAEVRRRLGPEVEIEVQSKSEALRIYVPEGYPSEPVSFGSDVPYLREIGSTLLVGPGTIHDAHTAGEKIGKGELTDAVAYYEALGEKLLAQRS
jgi:acetylornithine deacetylase